MSAAQALTAIDRDHAVCALYRHSRSNDKRTRTQNCIHYLDRIVDCSLHHRRLAQHGAATSVQPFRNVVSTPADTLLLRRRHVNLRHESFQT